jgi:hypothetical protein
VTEGQRWVLYLFIVVQVGLPLALLIARWLTGEVVWYGWGWQMFS